MYMMFSHLAVMGPVLGTRAYLGIRGVSDPLKNTIVKEGVENEAFD